MDSLFKVERRGYNRAEVDSYIKSLKNEIENLNNDVASLKRLLAEADAQKAALETKQMLIRETLINAEYAARKTVEDAKKQAESLQASYVENDLKLSREIDDKKAELDNLTKRVEYVLKSQLALLENNKIN